MKCFYHDDLDGRAAAWVVRSYGVVEEAFFVPMQYGRTFPLESVEVGEEVWIVDYSIEPGEMERLLAVTDRVTWIDHHKTAIERYAGFSRPLAGVRIDGVAGCVLTWQYLHGADAEIPRMIELVGDRDVWAWKHGDETRLFFAGSQLHDTSPCSEFWAKCLAHELPQECEGLMGPGQRFWDKLLEDGATVERYKSMRDDGLNRELGFVVEFEGLTGWAINRARISSDRLGERIKVFDVLLPFFHDGRQFVVSLYSEKVDVSALAKKYGGGGHKGASGFRCETLPWKRVEDGR